ncbi:hypothetical protein AWB79_02199 [Caballeronia hypogeia]|uniref:Uncharacterized protein n=1 Tax=Caballeronia hypogeia TaxID=1777140 RepID=A0A158ACQ0_9BURK|nr:hypothetical protein AWB79_02199 [Caballeronia hypogeia]
MLLPILADEHIAGWSHRMATVNGQLALKEKGGTPTNGWFFPRELQQTVANARGVLPSANEVFWHHTFLPVALPFVTHAERDIIRDIIRGEHVEGAYVSSGLQRVFARERFELSWCLECLDVDLSTGCGHPYWHLQHLIPGVDLCTFHKSRLVAPCGKCTFSNPNSRLARLPSYRCWCTAKLTLKSKSSGEEAQQQSLEQLTAEFAVQLLERPFAPYVNSKEFGRVLRNGFDGLVGAHNAVTSEWLSDWLDERLQVEDVVERCGLNGWSKTWHITALQGDRSASTLQQNACLVRSIFPSERSFRLAVQEVEKSAVHTESLSPGSAPAAKLKSKHPVDLDERREMRGRLERFLKANPKATRTDFGKAAPRCTSRWLIENDSEWYNRKLPKKPPGLQPPQQAAEQLERDRLLDIKMSRQVIQRYVEIIDHPGRPTMITETMLLSRVTRGRDWYLLKPRLHRTRALVFQFVEDPEAFAKRLYAWGEANPDSHRYRSTYRLLTACLKRRLTPEQIRNCIGLHLL